MSAAVFPFCVGLVVGGGLVGLALHALALRWMFAEARRLRAIEAAAREVVGYDGRDGDGTPYEVTELFTVPGALLRLEEALTGG